MGEHEPAVDGPAAHTPEPLVSARRTLAGERGATAVEYGLIVALIAGLIIVGVTLLGEKVLDLFQDTNQEMTDHGM